MKYGTPDFDKITEAKRVRTDPANDPRKKPAIESPPLPRRPRKPPPEVPRMNFDELEQLVTRMAREGEGADRMRALKMLQGFMGQQTSLPEPRNQSERVTRLSLLMGYAGVEETHAAYKKAHGMQNVKSWKASARQDGSVEDRQEGIAIHEYITGGEAPPDLRELPPGETEQAT